LQIDALCRVVCGENQMFVDESLSGAAHLGTSPHYPNTALGMGECRKSP
jgi:hypothetical protein